MKELDDGIKLAKQLEYKNGCFFKEGKRVVKIIELNGPSFECTILGCLSRVNQKESKKRIVAIDSVDPTVAFGCYLHLYRLGLLEIDSGGTAIITKLKCIYSAGVRYIEIGDLGVVLTVTSSDSDENPKNLPMVKYGGRFYLFEKWDPKFDDELMTHLTAVVLSSILV